MGIVNRLRLESPLYSEVQIRFRRFLQKIFKFEEWHVLPTIEKDYINEIINVVNSVQCENAKKVVEIGCGLGDVIGSLENCRERTGYDISPEVIKAAKFLHPSIRFLVGGFDEVFNENANCLIMVNFIHAIPENEFVDSMKGLLKRNKFEYIIFDSLERLKYSGYQYSHSGEKILCGKYVKIHSGKKLAAGNGAMRHVEMWQYCGGEDEEKYS